MCLFTCDFYQFLAQIHIYGMPLGQSVGSAWATYDKYLIITHILGQFAIIQSEMFFNGKKSLKRFEHLKQTLG